MMDKADVADLRARCRMLTIELDSAARWRDVYWRDAERWRAVSERHLNDLIKMGALAIGSVVFGIVCLFVSFG